MAFKKGARKTFKKTYKKKGYKRYKKTNELTLRKSKFAPVMCQAIGGFPKEYYCKLRHVYILELQTSNDPDGLMICSDQFPLNYPGDTQTIARAIQNWQTFADQYDEYVILGSKCEVQVFNQLDDPNNPNNGGYGVPFRLMIVPVDGDQSILANMSLNQYVDVEESQNVKKVMVNQAGQPNSLKTLYNRMSVKHLSGHKAVAENSDLTAYTGSTSTSTVYSTPIDRYNWLVAACPVDNSTVPNTQFLKGRVTITYNVKFFSHTSFNEYGQ